MPQETAQASNDADLVEGALSFAAAMHDGLNLDRYQNHLKKRCDEVAQRHVELLAAGAEDNVETQLAALKHILSDKDGYAGEMQNDNIETANFARTIDRRQGCSIAVCIVFLHVARARGWVCDALNIGGYFVARLDKDGARIIFDPSQACRILQAQDLRQLVKDAMGPGAELSASFYEPVSNKSALIHLQNIIKHKQIHSEDYAGALHSVEMMRDVDPDEYRLLLDAGVLYTRVQQPQKAIRALEQYIERVPDVRDRYDAEVLLAQIHEDML